jgi:hypothetical protein
VPSSPLVGGVVVVVVVVVVGAVVSGLVVSAALTPTANKVIRAKVDALLINLLFFILMSSF